MKFEGPLRLKFIRLLFSGGSGIQQEQYVFLDPQFLEGINSGGLKEHVGENWNNDPATIQPTREAKSTTSSVLSKL